MINKPEEVLCTDSTVTNQSRTNKITSTIDCPMDRQSSNKNDYSKTIGVPSNEDLRPAALVEAEIEALKKVENQAAKALIRRINEAYKWGDLRELHACFKESSKLIIGASINEK